jgi:hypothetical protein
LRLTTSDFFHLNPGGYSPYIAYSLTREGSVVYNCCWSSPAQSFLVSGSAGLMSIFYCLRFETPPTWRAKSPYLYHPETGWPSYTPRQWVNFSPLPTTLNCQLLIKSRHGSHRKHGSHCCRRMFTDPLLRNGLLICCSLVPYAFYSAGTCLLSRYLAMDVSSGSTIAAFRRHVTLSINDLTALVIISL